MVVWNLEASQKPGFGVPSDRVWHTWCKHGDKSVTSIAAIESSPEKSPVPCFVFGFVLVGKPRIPEVTCQSGESTAGFHVTADKRTNEAHQ